MPYAQINLAIDLALIVFLSFALLPKHPKFILALFALYLVPWFLPLQKIIPGSVSATAQTSKVPLPTSQPSSKKPAYDIGSQVQVFNPQDDPRKTLDKTQALYQQIIQVLGTATGTGNTPDTRGLDALKMEGPGDKSTRIGSAMEDLKMNANAAWFYLRLFWLAAAFLLWVQNTYIGALALIPSIIPLFYLARALPLAYEKIKAQPWMQNASAAITNEPTGQIVLARYSIVFAAVLIALATFFFLLLFWRQLKGMISRGLKRFLKPELYQVRFNGHLMDFRKEGKDLVIEGLHFKASRMVQDRKRPEVWRLGSGTVIEFIRREA